MPACTRCTAPAPELGAPTLAQWIAMLHPEDVSRVSTRDAPGHSRTCIASIPNTAWCGPTGEVRHVRAMAVVSHHDDEDEDDGGGAGTHAAA